ncbi:hypothetical protein O6H91_07G086000 [Diphasiastrum complanatum]|nr:hypothetical protein O6H91_07G086000 [Diphasiastrum complanatum]
MTENPCPVTHSWRGGRTNSSHDPYSLPISRSCCSDAFEDLSSSSTSYFLEPTSVLDLSSPSLDSMHSPLTLNEQRFQEIEQCLQEDVSLTENPVMNRFSTGFATELATASSSRPTDCDGDVLYESGKMADLRTTRGATYYLEDLQALRSGQKIFSDQSQLGMGDGSSEWMDCLMNDLHAEAVEVGIASCFERNPCESTHSSELPGYPCTPEESWREDFAFACSSDRIPHTSWTRDACPVDLLSASSSDQLLSSSNFTSLALPRQQPQYPSHLLALSKLCPPQDRPAGHVFDRRDALCVLTRAGLLGVHLERKGGDEGVRLLQLLIDCVASIETTSMAGSLATPGRGTSHCTNAMMKLRELSSAYSDPLQRVASHFTDAMAARLETDPAAAAHEPSRDESLEDMVMAFRAFNEACPYIKFAHLTANQAILEAMETADKVHIIDCGIVQGVQWAALLQAFATRPAGAVPPKIRITGIASPKLGTDPSAALAATAKRLTEFANLLNLQFEFCPVSTKLEDLDPSMLRLDHNEVLAVNFMFELHHLLDDSLQHLRRTLRLVQLLSPAVITVAEFEASINAAPLQTRFLNAFCFYAALFDSLDETMAREDPERVKVERLFFAKEIKNMMAADGAERKERRESTDNWRRLMDRAGFRSAPLSYYAISQARLLLWLYCENFTLMQVPGCLSLCWLEHPIVTVSAWHC